MSRNQLPDCLAEIHVLADRHQAMAHLIFTMNKLPCDPRIASALVDSVKCGVADVAISQIDGSTLLHIVSENKHGEWTGQQWLQVCPDGLKCIWKQ